MKTKILVKCPYCNFVNQITREAKTIGVSEVIRCDCEEGGCDKEFIINYTLIYSVKVLVSKITLCES